MTTSVPGSNGDGGAGPEVQATVDAFRKLASRPAPPQAAPTDPPLPPAGDAPAPQKRLLWDPEAPRPARGPVPPPAAPASPVLAHPPWDSVPPSGHGPQGTRAPQEPYLCGERGAQPGYAPPAARPPAPHREHPVPPPAAGPAPAAPPAPPAPHPAARRDTAPRRGGSALRHRDTAGRAPAGPRRPVRHQDPAPAFQLTAEALYENLVITADRTIAWFRLPLHPWSFVPEDKRRAMVMGAAARIARLTGRRCHLRVTARPFETKPWAMAFDTAVRGPAGPGGPHDRPRPAMPGPCEEHPWQSQPGCSSCRDGAAWVDFLIAEQQRLKAQKFENRDVYLGVEVTGRGPAQRLLGKAWSRAGDAERASLARQAETVRAAVEGAGLNGRPVTPGELQWLMARSCSIGLPAQLPASQDPRPAPFAAPAAAPGYTGADDLAAYPEDFRWFAPPWAQSVQVTRAADGATAHVTVLTVTDMAGDLALAGDSPWLQVTDRLPFSVETSVTFDVLNRKATGRSMERQVDAIRAQYAHILEHNQDPPASLERSMEAARRIQEETSNPEMAGAYVHAWVRLAVAGSTPDEARLRADMVAQLYAQLNMSVKQAASQFKSLREFVPGEPLSSSAHRRFMHAELLAGGAVAATAHAGQWHGFPIGVTTATARRPVMWAPFHLPEQANKSGMTAVVGAPGGGKSAFAGLMASRLARAGVPVTVLDPSGMMDALCKVPALADHARAVNLLESAPGTLCPYALVPEPRPGDFASRRAWEDACLSAESERRGLTEDILKMLLPPSALAEPGAGDALGEAVRRAPATAGASPRDVIAQLHDLGGLGESALAEALHMRGRFLASRLETLADHPLARLFFPRPDADPAQVAGRRRLLTVMTLRGLVIPSPDRDPEHYSTGERLSIPVLHLAAQLLRRLQFDLPRGARKAVFIDEAHFLGRDSTGRQTLNELGRDSRKGNTLAVLISQNGDDLLGAGVANLVGATFVFRTEGAAELAAAVGLLGLPAGVGHEARIAGLSSSALLDGGKPGECLFRDGLGNLERVQIDLGDDPDLLRALSTTPDGTPGQFDYDYEVTR